MPSGAARGDVRDFRPLNAEPKFASLSRRCRALPLTGHLDLLADLSCANCRGEHTAVRAITDLLAESIALLFGLEQRRCPPA